MTRSLEYQFLPTAAVVDDPVNHAVVILQGHFCRALRVFRLHGNGYDLPVDAGEQDVYKRQLLVSNLIPAEPNRAPPTKQASLT